MPGKKDPMKLSDRLNEALAQEYALESNAQAVEITKDVLACFAEDWKASGMPREEYQVFYDAISAIDVTVLEEPVEAEST